MRPIELELDLRKDPAEEQRVHVRQGERGATTVTATITDGGVPVDLTGYTVLFEMRHPRGALLSDEVTTKGLGTLTYTLPEQAAQETGLASIAYFALRDGEGALYATTSAFGIVIHPNAQGEGSGVARAYSSEIEEMLAWCEAEFEKHEAERDALVDAAVDRADDAASAANEAADLVHQAIKGDLDPLFAQYLVDNTMTAEEVEQAFLEGGGA